MRGEPNFMKGMVADLVVTGEPEGGLVLDVLHEDGWFDTLHGLLLDEHIVLSMLPAEEVTEGRVRTVSGFVEATVDGGVFVSRTRRWSSPTSRRRTPSSTRSTAS